MTVEPMADLGYGATEISAWNRSGQLRAEERDRLAAMAAVNAEMAVCSPDQAITMQFAHTHEARVGQIHGQIAILLYHPPYCWTLGLEVEIDSENSFSVQPAKCESRRS